MKKGFLLLLISVLFFCSWVQSQPKNKQLTEFCSDWATANCNLRGTLNRYGQYKGDLSKLTYASYLEHLKKNIKSSGNGVVEILQESEKHVFAVNQNSFQIVIYSKRLNAVLYDDANTSNIDTVKQLNPNDKIPDLTEFVKNKGFKISQN